MAAWSASTAPTPGTSSTVLNDPNSGYLGYPVLNPDGTITDPLGNLWRCDSSDFRFGPVLFPIAASACHSWENNNTNGEPHLDKNYPGYNFNISDQRRALEFITDFDRMVKTRARCRSSSTFTSPMTTRDQCRRPTPLQ